MSKLPRINHSDNKTMIIDNLSTVTVEAAVNPPSTSQEEPLRFAFIFGIAREGLSSFERDLYRKAVGDIVSVSVPKSSACDYFGLSYQYLHRLINNSTEAHAPVCTFTVVSVRQSLEKEIIQAMSRSIKHSCGGGGCDCGCS